MNELKTMSIDEVIAAALNEHGPASRWFRPRLENDDVSLDDLATFLRQSAANDDGDWSYNGSTIFYRAAGTTSWVESAMHASWM